MFITLENNMNEVAAFFPEQIIKQKEKTVPKKILETLQWKNKDQIIKSIFGEREYTLGKDFYWDWKNLYLLSAEESTNWGIEQKYILPQWVEYQVRSDGKCIWISIDPKIITQ